MVTGLSLLGRNQHRSQSFSSETEKPWARGWGKMGGCRIKTKLQQQVKRKGRYNEYSAGDCFFAATSCGIKTIHLVRTEWIKAVWWWRLLQGAKLLHEAFIAHFCCLERTA